MIAAMQKLKISRLWVLIIFLPGISNALRANCDYPAGKARPMALNGCDPATARHLSQHSQEVTRLETMVCHERHVRHWRVENPWGGELGLGDRFIETVYRDDRIY
jgi:hypothetical protein